MTISSQAPPSKRAKTDSHSKGVSSRRDGSGTNHRYQNNDLPEGCQDGNAWRRVFIPSVAHWAGGDVEPWGPDDSDLRETMQEMWDHIYRGRIQHEISRSGAVMKVVSLLFVSLRSSLTSVGKTTPHGMAWRVRCCSLLHPHRIFCSGCRFFRSCHSRGLLESYAQTKPIYFQG